MPKRTFSLFIEWRAGTGNPDLRPSPLSPISPSFIQVTFQTLALPYTGPQSKKMQFGRRSAREGLRSGGLVSTVLPTPMQKGPPCRGAGSDLAGKEEELLYGVDRYQFTTGPSLEGHYAVGCGEERVVAAPSDIPARVKFCAPLPDDDPPGLDLLAAVPLYTETLRVAVPTISARAYTFFMCHRCPQLRRPT